MNERTAKVGTHGGAPTLLCQAGNGPIDLHVLVHGHHSGLPSMHSSVLRNGQPSVKKVSQQDFYKWNHSLTPPSCITKVQHLFRVSHRAHFQAPSESEALECGIKKLRGGTCDIGMARGQLKEQLRTRWQGSNLPAPWDKAEPGRPMVMSHRAGGNEAPENTLAALRHAENAGSRVMQMDILPTADCIPVVFHDTNMRRATGVDIDIREASRHSLLRNDVRTVWNQIMPC